MNPKNALAMFLCVTAVVMVWWNVLRAPADANDAHRREPITYQCVFCAHAWTISPRERDRYFEKIKKKNDGDIPIVEMALPCPACDKKHAGNVLISRDGVEGGE